VCGLSARTVGRLRGHYAPEDSTSQRRVGLDGKARDVRPEVKRLRILEAIRAEPTASLRSIAQRVGTTPDTVRRTRHRQEQETRDKFSLSGRSDSIVERNPARNGSSVAPIGPQIPLVFSSDSALMSTSDGQRFSAWLDRTDPGGDGREYVMVVPLSRVYEVADEARRRAAEWMEFADSLERRVRRSF
jgi:hypothetical protein